ncbi:DnaD domain protein [Brevibacillus sp. SYSU BS000544]|uniref:DnaD domain protein n=1 Tax=Brevibacillus sp. SYSU BS000544 TaxID=3416443 RepID=UPI003CE4F908
MRVVWNELTPNDRYMVRTIRPVSFAEMGFVAHLYLPLIGTTSYSLYQFFVHDVQEMSGAVAEGTHRSLMGVTSLSLDRLLSARERLEAMGLLEVRRRENRDGDYFYEYMVKPPLTPYQFFQEDIWPVMLLNQVGKARYEQIRRRFADSLVHELDRQYPYEENITKRFYEVFHSLSKSEIHVRQGTETDQFFIQMNNQYPASPMNGEFEAEANPALDLSFIRLNLPRHIEANRVLIKENIEFFFALLHFYRISTWQLGQELNDWSLFDTQGNLDKQAVRKRFIEKYVDGRISREALQIASQDLSTGQLPEPGSAAFARICRQLSPLDLLESAIGGRINKAYLERAESLVFQDFLSPEVVNALLIYALRETKMELPKAYVETVRDSWKAKQISTVDDAVKVILERSEARKEAIEKAQEKSQEKAKTGKRDTASAGRKSGRGVIEDKLPASVERQLKREQEKEADKAESTSPPGKKRKTVMDDPELRAMLESLRNSEGGGDK